MKRVKNCGCISVNARLPEPIFLQIVHSVSQGLQTGRLRGGQRLPSINDLSRQLGIARDTVERAYRHLKKKGVIVSVPQKGYYTSDAPAVPEQRVLIFPGGRHPRARKLYHALASAMGTENGAGPGMPGPAPLKDYVCYAVVPCPGKMPDNGVAGAVAFLMIR